MYDPNNRYSFLNADEKLYDATTLERVLELVNRADFTVARRDSNSFGEYLFVSVLFGDLLLDFWSLGENHSGHIECDLWRINYTTLVHQTPFQWAQSKHKAHGAKRRPAVRQVIAQELAKWRGYAAKQKREETPAATKEADANDFGLAEVMGDCDFEYVFLKDLEEERETDTNPHEWNSELHAFHSQLQAMSPLITRFSGVGEDDQFDTHGLEEGFVIHDYASCPLGYEEGAVRYAATLPPELVSHPVSFQYHNVGAVFVSTLPVELGRLYKLLDPDALECKRNGRW